MRSRSTLLSHILGSNPAIDGYCELHQGYRWRFDLLRQSIAIRRAVGTPLEGHYRLDKILHNLHGCSPSLLTKIKPFVIFMLRPPAETFASLYRFGQQKRFRKRYMNHQKILHYYCKRLAKLEQISNQDGLQSIYLDSSSLVKETEATLHTLTNWLALKQPLSPNYASFRYTGTNYKGDTSEHIRSGKVLAQTSKTAHEFPQDMLDAAQQQFLTTRAILIENCSLPHATPDLPAEHNEKTSEISYFPTPTTQ